MPSIFEFSPLFSSELDSSQPPPHFSVISFEPRHCVCIFRAGFYSAPFFSGRHFTFPLFVLAILLLRQIEIPASFVMSPHHR